MIGKGGGRWRHVVLDPIEGVFFKTVLLFHTGFDAMEIKREEGGICLKEGGSNARIEVWVKATESK